METLKNYLELMFKDMPDTADVQKAKADLLRMMEEKYDALLSEGKSETEAVGMVIAEFGNLDELAEELGVSEYMLSRDLKQKGRSEETSHTAGAGASYDYEESFGRAPRADEYFSRGKDDDDDDEDDGTVLGMIQSVFWPTIVAIYLIWSFSTFDWGRSWVIWPIAAGVQILLNVLKKIWK